MGQLGVAIESRVADAGAGAFLVIVGIGLRFARDGGSNVRQIRIGILSARNQAVGLLGFSHFLKRENVFLLLVDGGGEQFAGLAGGVAQRVVELALNSGRAFARAEPGVEAGVGEGDGDDGCNNVNANQQSSACGVASSGSAEADQPGNQHERGLHADGREHGEPDGQIQAHPFESCVPGNDGEQAACHE